MTYVSVTPAARSAAAELRRSFMAVELCTGAWTTPEALEKARASLADMRAGLQRLEKELKR